MSIEKNYRISRGEVWKVRMWYKRPDKYIGPQRPIDKQMCALLLFTSWNDRTRRWIKKDGARGFKIYIETTRDFSRSDLETIPVSEKVVQELLDVNIIRDQKDFLSYKSNYALSPEGKLKIVNDWLEPESITDELLAGVPISLV